MKIFYVHHAYRDMGEIPSQDDKLKSLGIRDCEIVAELLKDASEKMNIRAIYSSEFFRCMETARLINEYINVPIIVEPRFNEFGSVHTVVKGLHDPNAKETWLECQMRTIEGIRDIVNKYDEKDMVICVTSGVNLTSFVSLAYGIPPSEKLPFPMVPSCSPIGFDITPDNFKILEEIK